MWAEFPPRMRRAVTGALEIAGNRGCDEASPEHLLLAIVRDAESAACFLLAVGWLFLRVRQRA